MTKLDFLGSSFCPGLALLGSLYPVRPSVRLSVYLFIYP